MSANEIHSERMNTQPKEKEQSGFRKALIDGNNLDRRESSSEKQLGDTAKLHPDLLLNKTGPKKSKPGGTQKNHTRFSLMIPIGGLSIANEDNAA